MFVVDTNVLVYAAELDVPENGVCAALVNRWRRGREQWGATWPILYEFLRVVTHPNVLRAPFSPLEAWAIVASLLQAGSFRVLIPTERHSEVARTTLAEVPALRGNVMHDVHTAVVMREHGVRQIYTRDLDFHRFPFLEVVDPLTVR